MIGSNRKGEGKKAPTTRLRNERVKIETEAVDARI